MLSYGTKYYHVRHIDYHVELILWFGANVIMWDKMLSLWRRFYCTVNFKLEKVPRNNFNVLFKNFFYMLWSGVIMWCHHVVLSCDVIMLDDTPLFCYSWKLNSLLPQMEERQNSEIGKEDIFSCLYLLRCYLGSRQNDIRVWTFKINYEKKYCILKVLQQCFKDSGWVLIGSLKKDYLYRCDKLTQKID